MNQISEDVLIFLSNETTSVKSALGKLSIIHCHPSRSVFFTDQIGEMNGDEVKITKFASFIFHVHDGGIKSQQSLRFKGMCHCFCFTIFLGRGSFDGFYWWFLWWSLPL